MLFRSKLRAITQEMNTMFDQSLAIERIASDWYRNFTNAVQRTTATVKSSDSAIGLFPILQRRVSTCLERFGAFQIRFQFSVTCCCSFSPK